MIVFDRPLGIKRNAVVLPPKDALLLDEANAEFRDRRKVMASPPRIERLYHVPLALEAVG
ncbi:MAG: hypothetical protein M3468_15085 [Acidobacteriota bacterium]|nr:hypothetical protein [Acidobacteriota bacterium]MDQ3489039.1 hypothetical protein [Acidobacteriota bacterium]